MSEICSIKVLYPGKRKGETVVSVSKERKEGEEEEGRWSVELNEARTSFREASTISPSTELMLST